MNRSTSSLSRTPFEQAFQGSTVWLSGHTGFKGSLMAHWLLDLGAKVHGFSLVAPTTPALFDQIGLAERLFHRIGDLRDARAVMQSINDVQPDFVFHLAAQAIVRTSFDQPVETYMTNVMGTVHVMEALRNLKKRCAAVVVTSDKCYLNREIVFGYREEDPLGGVDPYSSSKACAELTIDSWRRSFFTDHPVRVATARAGNCIGPGDWAKDRILPDCIRSLQSNQPIAVRNKIATRPWQHAFDPLAGYLWLAAVLRNASLRPYDPNVFTAAFNFGPRLESNRTVAELVAEILKHWPGHWEDRSDPNAMPEAKLLNLSSDRAFHLLGWKGVWGFEKAVAEAVAWYRKANESSKKHTTSLAEFTSQQIAGYQRDAARAGVQWTDGL